MTGGASDSRAAPRNASDPAGYYRKVVGFGGAESLERRTFVETIVRFEMLGNYRRACRWLDFLSRHDRYIKNTAMHE